MNLNIRAIIILIMAAVVGIAIFRSFPAEVIIVVAIVYFILIGIKMIRSDRPID